MTLKDVYDYCVGQGIDYLTMTEEATTAEDKAYLKTKGMTLLHLASCIYENELPGKHGKRKEQHGKR